jgi:hypothetical protein
LLGYYYVVYTITSEINCKYVIESLEEYGQSVAMQAIEIAQVENSSQCTAADTMLHVVKHCREIIQKEESTGIVKSNEASLEFAEHHSLCPHVL